MAQPQLLPPHLQVGQAQGGGVKIYVAVGGNGFE